MDRWDIESEFWEWVDPDDSDTRSGDCMTSLCFRIPENANSADPNYMNLSISRIAEARSVFTLSENLYSIV